VCEEEDDSFDSGTDWMLHVKDTNAKKGMKNSSPSVSTGFTAVAKDSAKKLEEYSKMKKKLEHIGSWTGNGKSSIVLAYKQGKLNTEQYNRYLEINAASNTARHQ